MKNILFPILLILIVIAPLISCDKEEDGNGNENNNTEVLGCTNTNALNYNPEATEDDGSCIILGCTDESAMNYNPEATDDDNSCEYSVAFMLDGTWNIALLDYETEIDLSFLEDVIGFPLGNQEISGQAENAGTWYLNTEDYSYNSELDFDTEPITIVAFEVPSIPFEYSNSGTWELTNNETDLILIDDITGEQADYEIVSITENTAFMNGSVIVSQDIMGMDFTFELDVQMQLEKE
tara:strand:+ start:1435 stop:2145 length:711 start_codon:yes stop_codon:yes gene_type:complete